MSGNPWNTFCKRYAEEYHISYAAALKEAKGPYQHWKQENENKLQEKKVAKPRTVRKVAKKSTKKVQIIDSDSDSDDSDVEIPAPPKKKVVRKKAVQKKKKVLCSIEFGRFYPFE